MNYLKINIRKKRTKTRLKKFDYPLTEKTVQVALANYFNKRANMIIPNVSWGFFKNKEVDLVVIRKSMWMDEVEIKLNKSDLLKETNKKRYNKNINDKHKNTIRYKWFCVKSGLENDIDHLPEEVGVLIIDENYSIIEYRKPKKIENSRKITEIELIKLLRLGNLRTWPLREQILNLKCVD